MITNNKGATGPAVAFRDVVKVYHPDIKALDHVTFDIQPGETVALLGPNGAGKSTAIDTMLGLRAPTSGEVRILGGPAAAAVAAGQIGGMLQTGGLPEGAKVSELIGLFRQLYRDRRSTAELLTLAGVADLADRRVEQLSGGQTQRMRFALALAGKTVVTEPPLGTDPLTTDGAGTLTLVVPMSMKRLWATIADPKQTFEIRVGFLDPHEIPTGAVSRPGTIMPQC